MTGACALCITIVNRHKWTQNGYTYVAAPESESAILMPNRIAAAITKVGSGTDWLAVVADQTIYMSIHANDITKPDSTSRFPDVLTNVVEFVHSTPHYKDIIIGIDANTTLLPTSNTVGPCTLPPDHCKVCGKALDSGFTACLRKYVLVYFFKQCTFCCD